MRNSLLSTLAYFDMFQYPLTVDELYAFSGQVVEKHQLEAALQEMVREQKIFQSGHFYSLQPGTQLAARRVKGNKAAEPQLRLAARVAKLLSWFPYVRGVAISGSLSKNFADESSDIDLFIITARNRLWIPRTILCLFRKLFIPIGKMHWFCMNYFVDEEGMEIVEKNFFTAIEIATLIPVRGTRTFNEFFEANAWTRNYLPNCVVNNRLLRDSSPGIFKRAIEKILNLRLFDQLENRLMNITGRRWDNKTSRGRLNRRGILLNMNVSEHYAKPYAHYFQHKLLERYERKLRVLLGEPAYNEANP
jgi:predicted nucleotidyltransferase